MKFGIAIPSSHQGTYLPTPFAGPEDMASLVQLAERLGFDSAWGLDFMTPLEEPPPPRDAWPEWHEILTTLAFLAARTSRIRLGTAALQLPLRDPFTLARQAATIDVLSQGRLLLGVGLGFKRIEFTRMRPRDAKAHRGQIFEEYLSALHRFFTEDCVTIAGAHYACDDLCLLPRPVQNPLPIYLSGITDDVFDRIAKWGSGVLLARAHMGHGEFEKRLIQLDRALAAAGRDRSEIDLVVTNGLSLGKNREAALRRFHDSVLPARMDGIAARQGMASGKGMLPSQDINQVLLYNLIGSPDEVIEQAHALKRRGITHCVLYYNPVRDIGEMRDQLQWFGEAVLPAFRT